jgi:hypothetical protein
MDASKEEGRTCAHDQDGRGEANQEINDELPASLGGCNNDGGHAGYFVQAPVDDDSGAPDGPIDSDQDPDG